MKSYLVTLRVEATQKLESTVCSSNNEVGTLIANLDTNKYSIEKIEAVLGLIKDMNHFCMQNNNLETGEKGDS